MNPVYYTDEEYQDILNHLIQLTTEAESLPYPQAKEMTTSLLKYFDLVHREALARMIGFIEREQPGLKEKLETDFTINTLLNLYDLGAEQKRLQQEKDAGRVAFIPVDMVGLISPIMETVWIEAGQLSELKDRQLYPKELVGENVLLCKIDGKVFAIRNACLDSVLPMQFGKVEGYHLICPWHGCRYDIRNGVSLEHPGEKLATYRIALERDGTFKVGFLKEKVSS